VNNKPEIMSKKSKHPKGLMILFFTEMWERFGYYLMLGIFRLYMIESKSSLFPGMGLSRMEAADIYGTYLALVYLTPFFGGLIADRLIGYRKAIYNGGTLMAAGYIGLSIPNSMMAFYLSLLLIILGNGMFKPNVSVLLGKLYEKPEYLHLKDSGYNIFYMGINIGAFVCNFVAAWLRLSYGWGWAFAVAGVGMIIGLIWFAFGNWRVPEIKEADRYHHPARAIFLSKGFLPYCLSLRLWLQPSAGLSPAIFLETTRPMRSFSSVSLFCCSFSTLGVRPQKKKKTRLLLCWPSLVWSSFFGQYSIRMALP
jgi:dipeptide/tripeptide permease